MEEENYQQIENCKHGDVLAKEWLYKKYAPVLLGICLRYIDDRMLAEDILHESFIVIFSKLYQLKQNTAIEGWMKRIVINSALKYLKSNDILFDINEINEMDIETDDVSVKEELLRAENLSQDDMLSVINSLPSGFRTVFNLYVFENCKHDEIAKKLGISVGTSRSQLRARKLIQKRLHELIEMKKKEEKKERVYLSSIFIFMNGDLDYIDKLVFDKLNGYLVTPHSEINMWDFPGNSTTGSIISAVAKKAALLMGGKAVWISTFVLGVSGLVLILVITFTDNAGIDAKNKYEMQYKQQNEFKIDTGSSLFVREPVVSDSPHLTNEKNKDAGLNSSETGDSLAGHDVIRNEVMIKKVVSVKKRKVVTIKKKINIYDTIKKTDTLQVE